MKPLCATARLQFHAGFTLHDALGHIPYFAALGISHLYASPLFTARAGSTHGYDVIDPTTINPELGGEPALVRLVGELRRHGMGLILDIVPNHMGIGGADNAWWLDVLEWGRASPYAEFFDIDWDPPDPTLHARLLAPFLGAPYGTALENGDLALRFDPEDGRLFIDYFGNRFPISPRDYADVLGRAPGPLAESARAFAALPGGRDALRAAAQAARLALRHPAHAASIAQALRAYDAQDPQGRDRLHRLLERQNFRLAWWRAASDEINWRRFFDINTLVGLRQEIPAVFEATHATIFRLYREALIDGVRVDHVDGLANPRGYCRKLRQRLETLAAHRPSSAAAPVMAPVIWVEKILAPHERLPTDWATDGTTGYDFMNDAGALLHDEDGAPEISRIWTEATGRSTLFEDEAIPARRQILRESLSSELFATAVALHRIARRNLATRDYSLTAIHRTLMELLAHFRVYRLYAGPGGMNAADASALEWALAGARREVRAVDRHLLELLGQWLSGSDLRALPAGRSRAERLRAMVRFQQLSAPTAAKSVEDTAFYRYGRLLSRNEVGSEPAQFALSAAAFHAANRIRARYFPRALLATATHDHKRGEDARARLAVLSHCPAMWDAALSRWMRLNAALKRDLDGPAPDAADEVMLYQSIIGAWPLDLRPDDRAGLARLRDRLAQWQEKALREAKRHSNWAVPDEAYEQACQSFLAGVLDPDRPARLVFELFDLVNCLAPSGALNSLSQMLLRLTSPGVPDLYQGTEYWDFSLVDPDNRRAVDFAARAASLAAAASPESLLPDWRDGRIKQAILHRALALRARHVAVFTGGHYMKLRIDGKRAAQAVAFARYNNDKTVITVISLADDTNWLHTLPQYPPAFWEETYLTLPRSFATNNVRDCLRDNWLGSDFPHISGHVREIPESGRLRLADILAVLPVALMEVE